MQSFYLPDNPFIKLREADGRTVNRHWRQTLHSLVETYTLDKWGDTPLNKLNFIEVKEWLLTVKSKKTGKPLHNQSRNHILYGCFRVPLRYARMKGIIAVNPFGDIEPFSASVDRRTRDVFTRDELERLFPQDLLSVWISEKWATIFLILTTTGIREGELRALQWKHFHPEDNYLHVERAVKSDGTIGPLKKRKTGDSRPVPLIPVAVAALKGWHKLAPFKDAEDLIFPGDYNHQRPLVATYFPRRLQMACKNASVNMDGRNLNVHSLRHTYITMVDSSEARQAVQALAGHRDARITAGYSHPTIEDQKRLLEPARPVIEKVFDFLLAQ